MSEARDRSEEAEKAGPPPVLSHFASFHFTAAFWGLTTAERAAVQTAWLETLRGAAQRVEVYQVFPARADADVLVWSAAEAAEPGAPGDFFGAFAFATSPQRRFIEPTDTLWGLTRPSPYAGGRPPRGIDAVGGTRQRYLTVYPFVKTTDWYLMSREARQGMMNEHIRIGRQYPEVDQLLLYSFGLQDQEFVVVYEMEDLARYSELVNALRSCEGRRHTVRDTPIVTAVHRPAEETLALFR